MTGIRVFGGIFGKYRKPKGNHMTWFQIIHLRLRFVDFLWGKVLILLLKYWLSNYAIKRPREINELYLQSCLVSFLSQVTKCNSFSGTIRLAFYRSLQKNKQKIKTLRRTLMNSINIYKALLFIRHVSLYNTRSNWSWCHITVSSVIKCYIPGV